MDLMFFVVVFGFMVSLFLVLLACYNNTKLPIALVLFSMVVVCSFLLSAAFFNDPGITYEINEKSERVVLLKEVSVNDSGTVTTTYTRGPVDDDHEHGLSLSPYYTRFPCVVTGSHQYVGFPIHHFDTAAGAIANGGSVTAVRFDYQLGPEPIPSCDYFNEIGFSASRLSQVIKDFEGVVVVDGVVTNTYTPYPHEIGQVLYATCLDPTAGTLGVSLADYRAVWNGFDAQCPLQERFTGDKFQDIQTTMILLDDSQAQNQPLGLLFFMLGMVVVFFTLLIAYQNIGALYERQKVRGRM